jgi:hypothetical protein
MDRIYRIRTGKNPVKEALINPHFVIPAKAGIQSIQAILDARLRGHDSFSACP